MKQLISTGLFAEIGRIQLGFGQQKLCFPQSRERCESKGHGFAQAIRKVFIYED